MIPIIILDDPLKNFSRKTAKSLRQTRHTNCRMTFRYCVIFISIFSAKFFKIDRFSHKINESYQKTKEKLKKI